MPPLLLLFNTVLGGFANEIKQDEEFFKHQCCWQQLYCMKVILDGKCELVRRPTP